METILEHSIFLFPHASTHKPPVTTAKAVDATSVVHRWDSGGSSVTTVGLRLVANQNTSLNYFLLQKILEISQKLFFLFK